MGKQIKIKTYFRLTDNDLLDEDLSSLAEMLEDRYADYVKLDHLLMTRFGNNWRAQYEKPNSN